MTGIFLIAAAVILSGFIISDVAYDPFMEDSQSMLFFTIGTYLTTPFFCFIGGFILLGIGKLIDLQEKHNAIVTERLGIICQNVTAGEHAREENETAHLPPARLKQIHSLFLQMRTENIGTAEKRLS